MTRQKVKADLAKTGVRPHKSRGQNFAVDPKLISSIIQFGDPSNGAELVEIGPGLGALTEELAKTGKPLTLIEVEEQFCKELALKYPNAKIINKPAQSVDLASIGEDLTVFGNIPYVFSTDILFHLIAFPHNVKRAVLLLQKEFADRVAAPHGNRTYGVLSVMAQLWCETELGPVFSGDSFYPTTKVDSRLLQLKFRDKPLIPEEEIPWFRRIVKAAFLNRRKMLHNSLKAAGFALEGKDLGVETSIRAERLSIEQLYKLSQALK